MKKYLIFILISIILVACEETYTPKPHSFYRIELPAKDYQQLVSKYPFTYEYPKYAEFVPFEQEGEKYWHNIDFSQYNATINMSYRSLKKNKLSECIADALTFVSKHEQKARGIFEKEYTFPEGNVYGVVYDIKGTNVASTYQFFLTDSVNHFVRGALYFMETPNNDSLEPVINFLKTDIDRLVKTFEWK
ncbi:gliding motility lipoprotein GldD [Bacteroidia bacterium]|nr:gliding motility lipoprotein GldD [Bacteroidia bacterium]